MSFFAIAPTSCGFGYVVFTRTTGPIDLGVKEAHRNKNQRCLWMIRTMLRGIKSDIVVIENETDDSCRGRLRTRNLIKQSRELIVENGAALACYSRQQICRTFGPRRMSKDDVAAVIVARYPALRRWLPKRRRIWESEKHSMAIFEAMMPIMVHHKSTRT